VIKRFDATLEITARDPDGALFAAKRILWAWENLVDEDDYESVNYNVRLLGENKYEVYLSYKIKETM